MLRSGSSGRVTGSGEGNVLLSDGDLVTQTKSYTLSLASNADMALDRFPIGEQFDAEIREGIFAEEGAGIHVG